MASLPSARQLSYASRRGTWRHLGRRAQILAKFGVRGTPAELSWPIDPEVRQILSLRWPRRYGWPNAAGWIEPLKRGIGSHVQIEPADIAQPVGNIVVFEALARGEARRVAIDYDDLRDLHEFADRADLYFKLQFRRGGYASATIVPGGYVSKEPALYKYSRGLRELRGRREPSHDVAGRFGIRSESARKIRSKAIAMLEAQHRFEFTGGGQAVWWGEYLDELCDARVCLDLPGRGELCYRLIDCLAIGACVIGPELEAELHVPLEPGVHVTRVPRSLDGLVEGCERLLADEELRSSLGRAAGDYFDRYLALEQLGAYYVDALWRLCGGR